MRTRSRSPGARGRRPAPTGARTRAGGRRKPLAAARAELKRTNLAATADQGPDRAPRSGVEPPQRRTDCNTPPFLPFRRHAPRVIHKTQHVEQERVSPMTPLILRGFTLLRSD